MKNLRNLRMSRGLTQKQLADALGIDRTAVAKYETGRNGATSEMLERIAKFFDVSIDYVLGKEPLRHTYQFDLQRFAESDPNDNHVDSNIQFAFYGDPASTIDDETMSEIERFTAYAKAQKNSALTKDEAELHEFMKLYAKLSPEQRAVLLAAAKGFAQDK